jgi:hypothetical protein
MVNVCSVYLRLRKNQRLEDVSEETIMECAQLVKANSIEGCKKKEVYVVRITLSSPMQNKNIVLTLSTIWQVYTRWRNLLKTNNMVAGQVSYHDKSKVKRMKVVKDNSIVNALNRTKTVSIIWGDLFVVKSWVSYVRCVVLHRRVFLISQRYKKPGQLSTVLNWRPKRELTWLQNSKRARKRMRQRDWEVMSEFSLVTTSVVLAGV